MCPGCPHAAAPQEERACAPCTRKPPNGLSSHENLLKSTQGSYKPVPELVHPGVPKLPSEIFFLDGQNRQSPIATVQRTRSTLAGHSAVPCATNVKQMNTNRTIRIAAQRTQGQWGRISIAAITLASDSAITIARSRPSKVFLEWLLEIAESDITSFISQPKLWVFGLKYWGARALEQHNNLTTQTLNARRWGEDSPRQWPWVEASMYQCYWHPFRTALNQAKPWGGGSFFPGLEPVGASEMTTNTLTIEIATFSKVYYHEISQENNILRYHSFHNHYILKSRTIESCKSKCRNSWKFPRDSLLYLFSARREKRKITCNCTDN